MNETLMPIHGAFFTDSGRAVSVSPHERYWFLHKRLDECAALGASTAHGIARWAASGSLKEIGAAGASVQVYLGSAGPLLTIVGSDSPRELRMHFAEWHVSDGLAHKFAGRLSRMAGSLRDAGLPRALAYEGDDETIIIEAGNPGRTLTLILSAVDTIAMYRSGESDDFGTLVATKMGAEPSAAQIQQVALNYLATLIWQSRPRTATSPQIASSADAYS